MKSIIKYIGVFILLFAGFANAQQNFEDFTFPHDAVKERKAIPYPFLREADVAYQKRVERIVDTREKQNLCLTWPRNHMGKIIFSKVLDGTLVPYRNDSLSSIFTSEEVTDRGAIKEQKQVPNPDNPDDIYDLIDTTIVTEFDPEKIQKWRIMEDWIFDTRHSVMIVRIIAIAPLFKPIAAGLELPETPLFWVRWDETREEVMTNQEMFNPFNDAARISMAHFFEKRMFSSYIIKESNAYDYMIRDYEEFKDNSMAALLEGEKIKQKLFEQEHDLWEY
jgi:gliding motility associated protien GldN